MIRATGPGSNLLNDRLCLRMGDGNTIGSQSGEKRGIVINGGLDGKDGEEVSKMPTIPIRGNYCTFSFHSEYFRKHSLGNLGN